MVMSGPEPVTVADLVAEVETTLRAAGVPQPRRDAEILAREVLGVDAAHLVAHPDHPVSPDLCERIRAWGRRRAAGEPIQHILGWREFWKDRFEVTPDVLIPRPETELLVERGAALLGNGRDGGAPWILDLAAGSGCVGLSLLREAPAARLVLADVSLRALSLAVRNARRLSLETRCAAVAGDGLAMLAAPAEGLFDLIVSNPPYLGRDEIAALPTEIRDHEPRAALWGGEDGLDFYRRWLGPAVNRLRGGGHLLMECGAGQWPALKRLLSEAGLSGSVFPDLAGIPRVFQVTRPCPAAAVGESVRV